MRTPNKPVKYHSELSLHKQRVSGEKLLDELIAIADAAQKLFRPEMLHDSGFYQGIVAEKYSFHQLVVDACKECKPSTVVFSNPKQINNLHHPMLSKASAHDMLEHMTVLDRLSFDQCDEKDILGTYYYLVCSAHDHLKDNEYLRKRLKEQGIPFPWSECIARAYEIVWHLRGIRTCQEIDAEIRRELGVPHNPSQSSTEGTAYHMNGDFFTYKNKIIIANRSEKNPETHDYFMVNLLWGFALFDNHRGPLAYKFFSAEDLLRRKIQLLPYNFEV